MNEDQCVQKIAELQFYFSKYWEETKQWLMFVQIILHILAVFVILIAIFEKK